MSIVMTIGFADFISAPQRSTEKKSNTAVPRSSQKSSSVPPVSSTGGPRATETLDAHQPFKLNEKNAVDLFSALSQLTRLRIMTLLVAAGPQGLAAGAIGEAIGNATTSRTSFHLTHLVHAGLVESRREGRSIIYSAVFPALTALTEFMRDRNIGHSANSTSRAD